MEVRLGNGDASASVGPVVGHGRKRKRQVDEDAESTAGDSEEQQDKAEQARPRAKPAPTTLASLSKDLKEVYNILQRSTAKGRLLAEQVRRAVPMAVPLSH